MSARKASVRPSVFSPPGRGTPMPIENTVPGRRQARRPARKHPLIKIPFAEVDPSAPPRRPMVQLVLPFGPDFVPPRIGRTVLRPKHYARSH